MSAVKKIVGLIAGVSAVGVFGVAVAQGVPPNPNVSNPALGAGEQTVNQTPIGETGVLAWAPEVQQTAVLTRQDEQAAVATAPAQESSQEVASSSSTTTGMSSNDSSQQVAQAPSNESSANTDQSMGAPSQDYTPPRGARNDRG